MAREDFDYLPQEAEDALHNVARLLTIEERPYLRLSKRILKPGVLDSTRPVHLPSPPPDGSAVDEEAAARHAEQEKQARDGRSTYNEILGDIDNLNYAILRMALTTKSNEAERERYATEKTAITAKQQSVRDNIERLRSQLQDAKEMLAIRKRYDEQTEKITSSKMLKPRDEQAAAHAKLDEEIAELQQEVEASKHTWAERGAQFRRIEEEAKEMLRMIKDEKEEAERKEGIMRDEDDNDHADAGSTRGASRMGTPRPDGSTTPMHITADEGAQSLRVPQDRLAPLSRGTSAAPSPRSGLGEVEMADDVQIEDGGDSSGIEEGEEEEDNGPPDQMHED